MCKPFIFYKQPLNKYFSKMGKQNKVVVVVVEMEKKMGVNTTSAFLAKNKIPKNSKCHLQPFFQKFPHWNFFKLARVIFCGMGKAPRVVAMSMHFQLHAHVYGWSVGRSVPLVHISMFYELQQLLNIVRLFKTFFQFF